MGLLPDNHSQSQLTEGPAEEATAGDEGTAKELEGQGDARRERRGHPLDKASAQVGGTTALGVTN